MKTNLLSAWRLLALLLALPLCALAQSDLEKSPAYLPIDKAIDSKTVTPAVNVNLPRFLLMDVAAGFDGSTNDPLAGTGIDFKDLIKDVKLIRLMIIEDDKKHHEQVAKGVADLRAILRDKWTAIVNVPDGGVSVYAIGDASGDGMAGVAVIIYDGDDAIIGNIVGKVSIGKLLKIAGQFKSLPPEFMEKLMGATNANAQAGSGNAGEKKPDSQSKSEDKTENKEPTKTK
jgi:hypothetical protein